MSGEVGCEQAAVQGGDVTTLTRRTWCYARPPAAFEVAPCECGNEHTQWSEFERHLWCDVCKKDFVPAHGGVFSGPIPVKLAAMLGVTFDRIDLATGKLDRYDLEAAKYASELAKESEQGIYESAGAAG
jgi:ribosomal protein S27E